MNELINYVGDDISWNGNTGIALNEQIYFNFYKDISVDSHLFKFTHKVTNSNHVVEEIHYASDDGRTIVAHRNPSNDTSEYDPALHIYNWVMNDAALYSRWNDYIDYIKRNPTHIISIATTASNLAIDAVRKAIKCRDFSPEHDTQEIRRQAASQLLREAEYLSGVTIK